ncbi:uncharacterized protein TNCV_692191 [Trichonephila clavipes]|nr:uncharacterized protein TNCV_692191 [Trichonephila clavipes]
MSPLQTQPSMVCPEGIVYKGTLACNPRCSRRRRIDEADISTPVVVDQRAANCLKEAVRSSTVMRSRCQSSRSDVTFRRPLPVFRAIRCSSCPLLPNTHHCVPVPLHMSSYCVIGKSSFSKVDNPPPFKLQIDAVSNTTESFGFNESCIGEICAAKCGAENGKIVRVQYFVRGGFVGHRSRASSKHLYSHLPVDGVRFHGGQKGVALQLQDARVGVGSNKDADHSRCSEK